MVAAIPLLLFFLVIAALGSKLVGAGIPARLAGLSGRAAMAVGIAMCARGAVELIIADFAKRAGLFQQPDSPLVDYMFSAIVIVAVFTALVVPVCLRLWLGPPGGK